MLHITYLIVIGTVFNVKRSFCNSLHYSLYCVIVIIRILSVALDGVCSPGKYYVSVFTSCLYQLQILCHNSARIGFAIKPYYVLGIGGSYKYEFFSH